MRGIGKNLIIPGIALILGICYSPVFGEDNEFAFPYDRLDNNTSILNIDECESNSGNCTDLGNQIDITGDNSMINNLIGVFGLNSDTLSGPHKFINYAKAILNMALGLLSLIALVMTIYTFYMMFFTENEAGIKKAKGNLVGIFIALAIIGLSWLIVSFIFRRYQNNWQNAQIY